ncbi:transposase [Nonomuraea sp. LPB2021202275-12-8]|uniref:transposase n=1 Tax=Nonomuraea sp. LPB2021202275-12-8 TaxID=3120159 RepID=UPI00300D4840
MDRRWVGSDGCEIVLAMRAGRQVLRVRRHGWLVADCASVEEVARHVDLADLCEIIALPARPATAERVEARTSSHHR